MPKRAVATMAAATWGLGVIAGLSILVVGPLAGGEGVGIRASVTGVVRRRGRGSDCRRGTAY